MCCEHAWFFLDFFAMFKFEFGPHVTVHVTVAHVTWSQSLNFQVTLALSSRSRRTSLICWRRPRMSRQSGLISRRGYPSFFIWFVQSTCAKPSILRSPFSLLLAISERHFCLYIFGLAGTLLSGAVAAFPATWLPLILFQHFSFLSSTICLLPSNYVYIISLSI